MKTQNKIALVFFLTTLSVITLIIGSVYYLTNKYSFTDFYKRLEIRAVVTAKSQLDSTHQQTSALKEMKDTHLEKLPEEKEYIITLTPETNLKAESEKMKLPLSLLEEIIKEGQGNYKRNNVFYAGISYGNDPKHIVVYSAENYYVSHHLSYLRNISIIAVIVATLIALMISIQFSKHVFNPVKSITGRVKDIGSTNLHLRLKTTMENDEINQLASTFNNMLDRLETAFETQNNFISNASHELGTPLTAIIGETDVALARPRKPEEYVETLKIISEEAERLNEITKSLLLLARSGFNGYKQKFEMVRLDQLLWEAKETFDKINPDNQLQLNFDLMPEDHTKLKISGNEQLLQLAFTNIIANACKYSRNQPVKVSIGASNSKVILVVQDQGIGIPENELKYIYDPFFRASNTGNFNGYGIGMPLTRNIVRIHNGDIHVSSKINEGTIVKLSFPRIDL